MTSKFSRFLHLERSRAERPNPKEPSQLQNGQRFEAVAGPRETPQAASVPEAHLERFKRQGETPLALADPAQEVEHFPRCGRCEAENGAFAQACTVCGADLTTPQQREYNEQLRQSRQQAAAQAHEAAVAFEQERKRHEAQQQEDASRYALLLKKTRMQEQAGAWSRMISHHGSLGLALLGLIPYPAVRWAVLAGVILLPLLLWRFGRGMTQLLGLILGVIFLVLLVPPGRR